MKKVFTGILTAALAAVMCVSFAACGTSAKSVSGKEVTKEQWEAAFAALEKSDAQFTIETEESMEMTMTMDLTALGGKVMTGGSEGSRKMTYVNNGTKQSAKGSVTMKYTGDYAQIMDAVVGSDSDLSGGTQETETYSEKTTLGYTRYEKGEDGTWKKNSALTSVIDVMSDILGYADDFDDYVFNADLKGYVVKDYKAEDDSYEVIKFNAEGQLVAIYSIEKGEEKEDGMESVYSQETGYVISYKAGEIEIPTVA